MKRLMLLILLGAFIMAGGYPEYRMGFINDRKTISHLDGIWHDVKVELDENGNVVYRAVHELSGQPADSDFWCVWKYTYDNYNRPTRIEGPLCGHYGWENKINSNNWYPAFGSYNSITGYWDSEFDDFNGCFRISLSPLPIGDGRWSNGLDIKKIKVTWVGQLTSVRIVLDCNDGESTILDVTDTVNSSEHTIDNLQCSGGFDWIDIYGNLGEEVFISKIEFYFNPYE